MSFKHRLSRRLGALCAIAVAALAIGCADAPTSAADQVLIRPTNLDPALAITGSVVVGQRVSTDRYLQIFATPSRSGSVLGQQPDRAPGSVLAGPTAPTSNEPYPLIKVNFDTGPDGWVLAAFMSLLGPVVPPPPPPPPPVVNVASVSVTPATATMLTGTNLQLTAVVRDSLGNVLTGRPVTWMSSNASVASVTATGSVSALSAGAATITATSATRSGTAAITVQGPVVPPPPPPPPPTNNSNFASRWATATGNTQAAFLDTSNPTPWGFVCCSHNTNVAIQSAASLGLQKWPVANVYRVGMQAGSNGIQTHQIQTDLGAPAPNSHRYFRLYMQVTYGDDHGSASESNVEHGIETTSSTFNGGRGLNLMRLPRNDGTWFPAYRDISSGYRYIAPDLRLLKNRTYRVEFHVTYLASTYSIQFRFYDEDGVLVATEADFFQYLPFRVPTLRLGPAQFAYAAEDHRYFRVGTNGPISGFPMANMRNDNIFMHGAVAVCSTGWCGPVVP